MARTAGSLMAPSGHSGVGTDLLRSEGTLEGTLLLELDVFTDSTHARTALPFRFVYTVWTTLHCVHRGNCYAHTLAQPYQLPTLPGQG